MSINTESLQHVLRGNTPGIEKQAQVMMMIKHKTIDSPKIVNIFIFILYVSTII